MGDLYNPGEWSKTEMRGGINWQELWAPKESMERRGPQVSGKLVLARMDNSTAALRANYGAGGSPQLTMLARGKKELEVSLWRTSVALHIVGGHNSAADALSRFTIWVHGRDHFSDRERRAKFRRDVEDRCGRMAVDMMASDGGSNA